LADYKDYNQEPIEFEVIKRLIKDLRTAANRLSPSDVRYLVDTYYQIQEQRKRAANQVRAAGEAGEPNELVNWIFDTFKRVEYYIKKTLDTYTDSHPIGVWSKSIHGIGPVISAGLLAHIDIEKAPTAGAIWRYAGLDPTAKWEKGQVRPWNARLKTLCWKVGENFQRAYNNPKDIYGKIYRKRKEYEWKKNMAGDYAMQAEEKLKEYNIGKNTDAYRHYSGQYDPSQVVKNWSIEQGIPNTESGPKLPLVGKGYGVRMLPPAHINERAKRYAVKLFLAHWHEMAYLYRYGEMPPKPYSIAILDHAHKIEPPNKEIILKVVRKEVS